MFKKMFTRFSKVVAAGLVLSFMFLVPGAEASHWGLSGGLQTHDPTIVRESGNTWWSASTGTGIGMKYSTNGAEKHGPMVFLFSPATFLVEKVCTKHDDQ